jgi:predicted membrane channel-forming protein YqfA (hemolysin III family)
MQLIDQFYNDRFPLKRALFIVLLFFFILGVVLLISGLKITTKNKGTKIVIIALGVVLILIAIYFLFWLTLFGYNS